MDDRAHGRQVWGGLVDRKFILLSDPGARVIRQYGILHPGGGGGQDIALDTTLLVDKDGRERWRHVSETLADLPSAQTTLNHIQQTQ